MKNIDYMTRCKVKVIANLKTCTGVLTKLVKNTDVLTIMILIELLFIGYR